MTYDMLLKNGRLLNPKRKIDRVGDLAVLNGRLVFPQGAGAAAKKVVDVTGCLVLPGVIDIHAHLNYLGNASGMPVDLPNIPSGVTAAVDAGSTGVSNYAALVDRLSDCETRTKIMLNVSAGGIIMASQFPESVDYQKWDTGLFDEAFARCGEQIIALKIRISRDVVKALGLKPLEKALELAERYGTRVAVHTTDPPSAMGDIADMLRGGDILAHCYQGDGNTCIDASGRVCEPFWKARARGVLFDTSCGQGNLSLTVARQAIEQGFLPDTISTDMNIYNWAHPFVYNMPAMMSKFLALGMTTEQVVDCVTEAPAVQWGEEGNLGCLLPDSVADISVFKLKERTACFQDKFGNRLEGDRLFIPCMTVIGGRTVYQSMDLHP